MVDLRTRYMGLELPTPLVVAASPLSREAATVKRLEAAGAGAVVMFSVFEEQFTSEPPAHAGENPPDPYEFLTTPSAYLDHIRRLKDAVGVPVIASLNACTPGRWLDYARSIESAGADGIELDIYRIVADPTPTCAAIEESNLEMFRQVRAAVSIPVAVKLAPYITNLASVAARFDDAGADALVLFNRFYAPTVDIERRKLVMSLELSGPDEARLHVAWIAMLKGQVRANLAATGGIHGVDGVLRALMVGADVAMLCSVLLRHGPDRLADIHRLLVAWLESHEHASVDDIRGVMRLAAQAKPEHYKRVGYTRILNRVW